MGGGVEGYEVELDALDRASTAYHGQGDVVQAHLEEFRSKATLDTKAFGNLPQSAQLAEQYHTFFGQIMGDVTKLSASLHEGGTRMSTSADNYRKADAASTIE
jgi:hypothetical protein